MSPKSLAGFGLTKPGFGACWLHRTEQRPEFRPRASGDPPLFRRRARLLDAPARPSIEAPESWAPARSQGRVDSPERRPTQGEPKSAQETGVAATRMREPTSPERKPRHVTPSQDGRATHKK